MNKPTKVCRVCAHGERTTIDGSISIGQAPRSIARRYSDLSRRAIAAHRDECLKAGKAPRAA